MRKPLGLYFVHGWLYFMALRIMANHTNSAKEALRDVIFSPAAKSFFLALDVISLVSIIAFIILFHLRKRYTWRYFLGFMTYFYLAAILEELYLQLHPESITTLTTLIPLLELTMPIYVITTILFFAFITIFYGLLVYYTYKHREYFKR